MQVIPAITLWFAKEFGDARAASANLKQRYTHTTKLLHEYGQFILHTSAKAGPH